MYIGLGTTANAGSICLSSMPIPVEHYFSYDMLPIDVGRCNVGSRWGISRRPSRLSQMEEPMVSFDSPQYFQVRHIQIGVAPTSHNIAQCIEFLILSVRACDAHLKSNFYNSWHKALTLLAGQTAPPAHLCVFFALQLHVRICHGLGCGTARNHAMVTLEAFGRLDTLGMLNLMWLNKNEGCLIQLPLPSWIVVAFSRFVVSCR